ncbi:MAG: ABC transporter ATP-binding protein [Oscillospiraceae bacterium]|nr:ABC transporter ATP-binding protein [Oscillospiraceae bacterium]
MNNALEVRGLCKSYGDFSLEVSFQVPRGYITGFIGPNGAGKTTTLKSILNIVRYPAGEIRLLGRDSRDIRVNGQVGVVMDSPMYLDDWRLSDVERAISPFYGSWDRRAFADYLKRFGLDPKKKVKELSRGMKVKLQMAAALSHDAAFLLLDEPTSGLDPVARDEICALLREFVSDDRKSVLFSTHITSDLEKTADYITFLLNGRVVFTGAKDALLEKYVRVAGGLSDINEEQKKLVTGYREHGTGFEGMVEAASAGKLPKTVLTEAISLDELIIFMNKGESIHA